MAKPCLSRCPVQSRTHDAIPTLFRIRISALDDFHQIDGEKNHAVRERRGNSSTEGGSGAATCVRYPSPNEQMSICRVDQAPNAVQSVLISFDELGIGELDQDWEQIFPKLLLETECLLTPVTSRGLASLQGCIACCLIKFRVATLTNCYHPEQRREKCVH